MNRNSSFEAIILSTKTQGENNRLASIFCAEKGIFNATLYGGPKSRLRSQIEPWNRGTIWLYTNFKDGINHIKINDFSVTNSHLSFRKSLFKTWAASLAAEILIKSKCAGDYHKSWILFNAFLDGLDACTTEFQEKTGLLRFLWRYIELLGVQPDCTKCNFCQKDFFTLKKTPSDVLLKGVVFDPEENAFFCRECSYSINLSSKNRFIFLESESVLYLNGINTMSPSLSREQKISQRGMNQLKELLFFLIEQALSCKLLTLQSGLGIL